MEKEYEIHFAPLQGDTHGRSHLADSQVHCGDHAEVDGVDAQLGGYGVHDGDKDVHGGVGVHEAACNQEDHVDDQQEDVLVAGDLQQQSLGRLRNAEHRAHIGEQGGRADDQHDAAGGLAGVDQNIDHILHLDLTIDEDADHQTVYHGDGSRLGGGENAAVDAADDDDGHQEAPEGLTEGLPALAPGGLCLV